VITFESTRGPAADVQGAPASAVDEIDRQFARLLDARDLGVVFQPLVDLGSGQVVALEALVRGPEGTALASPAVLFDAARRTGRVAELDWVCRATAFAAFLDADVPPSVSLFVNAEPEGFDVECPADLMPVIRRAESHLRVFVEVNDRALVADPAGVLAAADRAREMGWGIAIDNVGSSPSPIAMLPIVGPDLIKLDLRRLRDAGREATAEIVTSVLRHTEKTGAVLLIEGIETAEDEQRARAFGAAYGQGYHLGRPGPLGPTYAPARAPIPLIKVVPTDLHVASPFELFEGGPLVRTSGAHLGELGQMLAYRPHASGCPSVYLLCVGDDETPAELVASGVPESAMVFVVFGTEMPAEPAAGARGVRLPRGDAFAGERFLVVLSDQAPAALFAKAVSPDFFDAVVTQDFELVHEIARHIIRRIPAHGLDNTALGGSADEVEVLAVESVDPEPAAGRSWRGWRSARP
jgi:EAL domain-containing protein (putative c-di-GMP-specific phosphodiesterase class I)